MSGTLRRIFNLVLSPHLYLFLSLFALSSSALAQQINGPKSSGDSLGINQSQDPALSQWEAKDKYFLVVAATKTGGQDTNLPYAKVDGNKVSDVLSKNGYKKIQTLTGKEATRDNFIENLKQIRKLKPNGLVVIYYSGHGAPDPQGKDLWLQLYGQKYFGESHGISVAQIIDTARAGIYKGELVVIIDACYSSQGAWTKSLNVNELENTLIFASSSWTQQSLPIEVSPSETMSAFTYFLLKGLTEDWDTVDENHDGIIQYGDLRIYIEAKLAESFTKDNQTEVEMTPEISGQQERIWAGFNASKSQNLKSLLRQSISFKNYLNKQLRKPLAQDISTQALLSDLSLPPSAQELAKQVPPNADPFTRALQAIAEDRTDDAMRLLDEAEKSKVVDPVDIYQMRGTAKMYRGLFAEGKGWYEKALKYNRKDNPDLLEEAGLVFMMTSDFDRAEELFLQAVEVREKSTGCECEMVQDLIALGMINLYKSNLDKSGYYFEKITKIDQKVLNKVDHNLVIAPRSMLALISLAKGNMIAAEKNAREIIATPEVELRASDPFRSMAYLVLAALYAEQGNVKKYKETMEAFLTPWEQSISDRDIDDVEAYINFVWGGFLSNETLFSKDTALLARFEAVCIKSLGLFKEFGDNDARIALALSALASAYFSQEKYGEAESNFKEALKISNKTFGTTSILSTGIYLRLGELYAALKRYQEAEQAFRKALEIAERSSKESLFLLSALEGLAELYDEQERYDDASVNYRRLIEISQRNWGYKSASTLRSIKELASVYYKQKKYVDIEKLYRPLLDKATGLDDGELAPILAHLGTVYLAQQKYREAEASLLKAIDIERGQGAAGLGDLTNSLLWLMEVYISQKKLAEAETASREALALIGKLSPEQKDGVANMLLKMASTYRELNNYAEADKLYQKILNLYQNESENTRSVIAVYFYTIAQYYRHQGQYLEAEKLFKRAIEIDEKIFGKEHLEVALDIEGLAELYRNMYRYEEAIALYMRSIPIREKAQNPVQLAINLNNLGLLYIQLNRYAEAQPILIRAKKIFETNSETNSWQYPSCLVRLAVVYYAERQDYIQAEKLLKDALFLEEHTPQIDYYYIADDLRLLSNVYRFQRKYDEAENALRRAREVIEKAFGKNNLVISKILFHLGLVYEDKGNNEQAKVHFKEALEISDKLSRAEREELALWLQYFASALKYMRRTSEADTLDNYAKQIRAKLSTNSFKYFRPSLASNLYFRPTDGSILEIRQFLN